MSNGVAIKCCQIMGLALDFFYSVVLEMLGLLPSRERGQRGSSCEIHQHLSSLLHWSAVKLPWKTILSSHPLGFPDAITFDSYVFSICIIFSAIEIINGTLFEPHQALEMFQMKTTFSPPFLPCFSFSWLPGGSILQSKIWPASKHLPSRFNQSLNKISQGRPRGRVLATEAWNAS